MGKVSLGWQNKVFLKCYSYVLKLFNGTALTNWHLSFVYRYCKSWCYIFKKERLSGVCIDVECRTKTLFTEMTAWPVPLDGRLCWRKPASEQVHRDSYLGGWWMGSTSTGLPVRRPVFVSHVKPKIDVIAVVYSCYSDNYVVSFLWVLGPSASWIKRSWT